jgi:uncharacterized membrane protein
LDEGMNSTRSLPIWPAFALLGAAALALGLAWNAIPPTWAIHWDASGRANGWAHRDAAGVFGLLVLGALIILVIEVASRRPGASAVSGPAAGVARASRDFLRAVALAMAALFAFLSVELPLGPRLSPAVLAVACAVPVIAALVFGWIRMAGAAREVRRLSPPSEGYRAFYYSNAKDSRLWVPRPGGLGVTINFAHPLGWPVMLLVLAVPIALTLLSTYWHP